MEGSDLVSEFLRHIEDKRHLVAAIAVHVDGDVAGERACERFETQIAGRRLRRLFVLLRLGLFRRAPRLLLAVFGRPFLAVEFFSVPPIVFPLLLVGGCVDPGLTIARKIRHPGRRTAFVAIDPLRVLAARHFEAVGRARELHLLNRSPWDVFKITERPPTRLADPGGSASR